jgi:glyoxylate/hydroxypyruvate reductase A
MTDMPLLLVKAGADMGHANWEHALGEALPDLEIRHLDDPTIDPARVRYAFVWNPPPGRLARFPGLRLVVSDAVGVGHLLQDPALPPVPIVRMGGEELGQRMGEYVCLACLALLRDLPRSLAGRAQQRWDEFTPDRTARQTRVAILGLGRLGGHAATMLMALGFPVFGWSLHPRSVPGVECVDGPDALAGLLSRADIVVNLLPDTPATHGILDAARLALLPAGAGVVNAGRGVHLVLPDLIAAIDAGRLCGAVLDVFDPEPPPPDSPAWTHPRLLVTAHGAAFLPAAERVRQVAAAIRADERGETLPNLYDPAVGY